MMKETLFKAMLPAVFLALAGCNSDSTPQGSLSLSITDAPVDNANRVVVEFTAVSVKPAEGQAITYEFDAPRQIDLLALQGGESELLLDGVMVDAGQYEWVRLAVNAGMHASDSFIELEDGSLHALYIPSGNETGLKLVQGFIVPANGSADFTIDFDLRKSVVDPVAPGTPYFLKPALRLVDNTEVGSISGSVDAAIATTADCSPAVYVYEGANATTGDTGSVDEPVASAIVNMNDGSGEFEYTVAFLLAGEYTVALTCDADADAPESDDDIGFEGSVNATVEANQATVVNF